MSESVSEAARPFFEGSTGEVLADVMCAVALFVMFVVLPILGWWDGYRERSERERSEREREVWSWLSDDDLTWFAEQGASESVKREQSERERQSRNFLSPDDWMG